MTPRARRVLAGLAVLALGGPSRTASAGPVHTLTIETGHLYGPGPLADQETPAGALRGLELSSGVRGGLRGVIPLANNGAAEPNIPGEALQGGTVDGKLCDGTAINENIDVGFVELMNGRFKLLLAAVDGGPAHGAARFFLDEHGNWTIGDDIAIDPGFAWGLVKLENFRWSTGPRRLPRSTQTAEGHPGGVDQAGSRVSGDFIPGRLGDDDLDGRLDGLMNAVGSFPLSSVILPGAPFAQTRTFVSDIELGPADAAALSLANAASYVRLAAEGVTPADELRQAATRRLELTERHLARALARPEPALAETLQNARAAVARALATLRAGGSADLTELERASDALLDRDSWQ